MARLPLVVVLLASSAFAVVPKGGSLWVNADDVVLLAQAKVGSKLVAKLSRGTEVKWLGASDKDKQFHEVESGGKRGFVFFTHLTPYKPQVELLENNKTASPQSFVNQGYAKDANMTGGGLSGEAFAARKELIALEELNKAIGPTELAKKQKELAEQK